MCDYTGLFVKPWLDDGYLCVLVDPQHRIGDIIEHQDGLLVKLGCEILDAMEWLIPCIQSGHISFVAGFPPCTDVAVSGTRWWANKYAADKYFQAKAALVAEQCRMIGMLSGAPWFFENPVSAFSGIFGTPSHYFQPYWFTGYCPEDNYTKKTCLWSGGGFVMPDKNQNTNLGEPDDRIHKCPPGANRMNFRSATPYGFAQAVFYSNAFNPHGIGTINAR